ncbi:hypothetical protein PIB30_034331 [Stylosanthes scabra]|uniref:Uncharacterized protein n=1 Tax=Stylosanthes scabra TaxID=79078 RepID=A0ABU6TCH8_9FABA|nr:hypothetical protein [Stylosanthes scabra]
MAPRGRSRRAVRAEPAPGLAEEAGQAAQAGEAPQAIESLLRLNREYHNPGVLIERESIIAQALFLPYACSGATDAVHGRCRFRARHPASGLRLRRSTPVSICGALEVCLPWDECTITLQDVAYHLGLRTDGEPVGGCMRDFQEHYQQQSWDMVEQYLGARPPVPPNAPKESFAIKMVWLRQRLQHIPPDADADTLR